jgi:hypothetical protein
MQIQRVLVGLFDDALAPVALEAAAELARALGARLHGLFVEDALAFEAAAWPARQAITRHDLVWRPFTRERLAEAHDLAVRELRRRLQQQANAWGVAIDFETARGHPAGLLAQRSAPGDLLVVAEPRDPIALTLDPYRRLLQAALRAPAPVLYLPHAARRSAGPVIVLATGAEDPLLRLASPLAAALDEPLVVLAAGGQVAHEHIRQALRESVPGVARLPRVSVLPVDASSTHALWRSVREALRMQREHLLILRRALGGDPAAGLRLASERAAPVLLLDSD